MYVIGLDIGTTGTKAALVDESGEVKSIAYYGYGLITDGAHVEQDPEEWWQASCHTIRQVCMGHSPCEIGAISVSAQGATMLALDRENQVIDKAITWLDTRAVGQAAALRDRLGEDYVYRATGWKISSSLDAAKILYMKEREQYREASRFISTLEYINFRLTGRMVIDPTCAGIRQLYNVSENRWDQKILDVIGCSKDELPEILPAGAFVGNLHPQAAQELGLGDWVKVYNGAHDQYCASLGSGALSSGDLLLSTGTAWAVLGISDKPVFSESRIASCTHPVDGLYGNMVSLTGAGTAYQWMKDQFFEGIQFPQLDAECQKRIGKSKELIFIPWLSGNLYPFFLSKARGGFIGADLSSDRYDFALSIMESAAFSVRAAVEDFEAQGLKPGKIVLMGGASKSKVWMSILSSVLNREIEKISITDTCVLGAAAIALVGEGCFASYAEASQRMVQREPIAGTRADRLYYREKYEVYRRTLAHMAGFYPE